MIWKGGRPAKRQEAREAGKLPTQPTAPADPHHGVKYLHAFKIMFQQFHAEQFNQNLWSDMPYVAQSHRSKITLLRILNESEVKDCPPQMLDCASVFFHRHL